MNNQRKYYSHVGQDAWVAECLQFKNSGYFLDFGAFDGKTISNTFMLEKELNWRGICVEPNPKFFAAVCECRNAIAINAALWHNSRESLRFVDAHGLSGLELFASNDSMSEARANATQATIDVDTINPTELLKRHNAPRLIEFLSLDVEGCEFEILSNIDLSYYSIALMAIEHNHDIPRQQKIRSYLSDFGYDYVQNRNDDWFFHKEHLTKCLSPDKVYIDPTVLFEKVYESYKINE